MAVTNDKEVEPQKIDESEKKAEQKVCSSEDYIPVKNSRKWLKLLALVVFILCFIGTVIGLPLALTLPKTTTEPIPTPPAQGWLDWSEWTDCSVSCGLGQIVRSRQCVSYIPGNETNVCEGYGGSDEVEVQDCSLDTCSSGYNMIRQETDKANDHGVVDNLFLNRYPQVVTLNGENIDAENSTSNGYGAWRLTADQFEEIISEPTLETKSISSSLISNVNVRVA